MTTPGRRRRRLSDRLRAIAGRSDDDAPRRSRVHVASFEHTHRVWVPPDPPRRWFEAQDIEQAPSEVLKPRGWWRPRR